MDLKEARLRAGRSAVQIAKRCRVSRVTVHLWESGEQSIAPKHIEPAAKAYGVTVAALAKHIASGLRARAAARKLQAVSQ